MSDAPFFVGQRVRMTDHARRTVFPLDKSDTGTVYAIGCHGGHWYIRLRRDGYKSQTSSLYAASFWEAIPPAELAADEVAMQLAWAVIAGNTDAAKLLADRVMELCGATPTGGAV